MDYKELLEKYHLLLNENSRLTEENSILKAKLGITESGDSQNILKKDFSQNSSEKIDEENTLPDDETDDKNCFSDVSSTSDSLSKIRLFMSLFNGREDVYAKRWENKSKGASGYSPVCLNQWQTGVCGRPRIPCSKCKNKLYAT
ncbi:hypothetical protein JXL19_07600 [bacterium]|nr:hypothetical protein [bacterium]